MPGNGVSDCDTTYRNRGRDDARSLGDRVGDRVGNRVGDRDCRGAQAGGKTWADHIKTFKSRGVFMFHDDTSKGEAGKPLGSSIK